MKIINTMQLADVSGLCPRVINYHAKANGLYHGVTGGRFMVFELTEARRWFEDRGYDTSGKPWIKRWRLKRAH